MAVTITFSGQIDDVLYELRQLAAGHGPAAAARAEPLDLGPYGAHDDPRPYGLGPVTLDDFEDTVAGSPAAPKPVEQRVAEAIAALPKRSRRTKAEMEAARAAEAKLAEPERETFAPASPEESVAVETGINPTSEAFTAILEGAATPGPTLGEAEVAEIAAPAPTFDDLKRALSTVLETEGLGVESGRALVASFGAKKLTDLNAVEWPLFISKANALVAGGAPR